MDNHLTNLFLDEQGFIFIFQSLTLCYAIFYVYLHLYFSNATVVVTKEEEKKNQLYLCDLNH